MYLVQQNRRAFVMKNSFIRVLGSAEILRPQAGVASLKATIRCSRCGPISVGIRGRWLGGSED
jgi:hypothetical protein